MLPLVIVLALMMLLVNYIRRAAARARGGMSKAEEIARASSATLNGPHVRVIIRLLGTGLAARRELAERYAVEDEVERRGIGQIVQTGFGDGVMHFAVTAPDLEQAAAQIREVLAAAELDSRATVEVMP